MCERDFLNTHYSRYYINNRVELNIHKVRGLKFGPPNIIEGKIIRSTFETVDSKVFEKKIVKNVYVEAYRKCSRRRSENKHIQYKDGSIINFMHEYTLMKLHSLCLQLMAECLLFELGDEQL